MTVKDALVEVQDLQNEINGRRNEDTELIKRLKHSDKLMLT